MKFWNMISFKKRVLKIDIQSDYEESKRLADRNIHLSGRFLISLCKER